MRNILLIVVDCARADKTTVDRPGADRATARSARLPFLARLAAQGTSWSRYYAVSSTTTPSFATMFTGRLPFEHGVPALDLGALRPDLPTLAEVLAQAGYRTAADLTGPLIEETGVARGFSQWRCRERHEYLDTPFRVALERRVGALEPPWFYCLHLWEAHRPYRATAPFDTEADGATEYDRALSQIDAVLGTVFAAIDPARTIVAVTADHGERLEEDVALQRRLGGAHWGVSDGDFETIRARHGDAMARLAGETRVGHGFHLTEEQVHVPLVLAGPGIAPGRRIDALATQADLPGALAELAGLAPERNPFLAGAAASPLAAGVPRDRVYIDANGSWFAFPERRYLLRGWRGADWKYWRLEGAADRLAVLWNLSADPRETVDRSRTHPRIAQGYDRALDEAMAGAARTAPPAAPAVARKLRELGYL